MSSDDTLTRIARSPVASGRARAARGSDRDTVVYVEDGWVFRVKPGAPIECARATKGDLPHLDDAQRSP